MKRSLSKKIGLTFFLLVLTANCVRAQHGVFEIEIPFDFIIKGQTMPPGIYSVGRLNAENPAILIMKKTGGTEKAIFLTQSVIAGKNSAIGSTVSFRRYGDRYFLSRIYAGDEQYANELIPGKLELKLRRQRATAAQFVTRNGKLPGK